MAVKENILSDTPAPTESEVAEAEIEWNTVENELLLLQSLCGTRPLGISKYFQMACLVDKLAVHLNKEVTAKGIWNHLSTMYNLAQLESHEEIPFPNADIDFTLSTEDFGELMDSKSKEAEIKKAVKEIKKEKEEVVVKKEKLPETPQTSDGKKAVKRTRASTTPNSTALQVSPKRRRI